MIAEMRNVAAVDKELQDVTPVALASTNVPRHA
jgi:hypothetical protein